MIEGFVAKIEAAINNFSETAFTKLAADLASALWQIAALVFVVMMINAILQIKQVGLLAYTGWFVRIAIIIAMATSWDSFEPIYNGINGLADNISGAMTGGANVWVTLDNIVTKCFFLASTAFENATWGLSLTGVVLWVAGAIIAAFGTGLALIAKGGLAVALGLAPVFISTLMVSGSANIFAAWAKTVVGLVMVIVVLTGVVSLITALFDSQISAVTTESKIKEMGQFLAVCIIAIVMLTQIPPLASGMAGAIIAASSGIAAAAGAAGGMKRLMGAADSAVRKTVTAGKTSAAMASAARDGSGVRESASRAMNARRQIMQTARTQSREARQSIAADDFRKGLETGRNKKPGNGQG
ncbi:type IV secretion system protein [Ruegeria atlantica]|uniref:type IV secretion system protein n=1 Tax=Ruegeria atlantica TaxID=81569 RepID=UPI001480A725|nr:type IV secretion system protein [Ruegeria atlantica]